MSDQPLLLLAASGLAREALGAVRSSDPDRHVAFLDDDPDRVGTSVNHCSVVGSIADVVRFPAHALVICAGRGDDRERIVAKVLDLGVHPGRFATIVDPAARIGMNTRIGAGSIVLAGVVTTSDVVVGSHVVLMPHVTLTHDNLVADYATLCAGVALGGGVRVGRRSYIGMNASVRHDVRLGADVTIGMGAAVLRDAPDGETWIGLPARKRG